MSRHMRSDVMIKAAFFLLLMYFPLFLHLDVLPIRLWDESRYAVNALEMNQSGNFLIPHFKGTPDMWNSKPPLLIWFQVLCIKIFGNGELSIRLPSAIAGLMTLLTIIWISVKFIKDYWIGLIASLILVTTTGYVDIHGTRSGDTDALLTLFTTAYSFFFFMFLEENNKKYLHLFFVALTLAILTKGIQGMLLLPGLFILLIVRAKIRIILNKWFFIDLMIITTIVAAYYLLRESQNPGYLKAVWINEVGGRYNQVIEEHEEAIGFYFSILIRDRLKPWVWLLPLGVILGFSAREVKIRRLTIFSLLTILSYLIIITIAKTKVEWYLMPIYPFLAILLGTPVYIIFKALGKLKIIEKYIKPDIFQFLLIGLFFFKPYSAIIDRSYWPEEKPHEIEFYSMGYFLQDAVRSDKSLHGQNLCVDGLTKHLDFYIEILEERGQEINFIGWEQLETGDRVLAHQSSVCQYIDQHYQSDKVYHHNKVIEFSITGVK